MVEKSEINLRTRSHKGTQVVDTMHNTYAKLHPVPIENVRLVDAFWTPRLRLLREVTLPSQHQLCEETGRIFNFRRAAGKELGSFQGSYFNDSDVYKWVEAVAFSLAGERDPKLVDIVRRVVAVIAAAQDEDGYLNNYFTFERKKDRWTNLRDMHELYSAGHLMQAAVAYNRATGEHVLLDVACRFADHISNTFGLGKRPGTCGHPEIEMALVELYRATGREVYLNLARFFLDQRGRGVIGGRVVLIDHKPFRELSEVVGHAVRSLYLNAGAADIYLETGEKALWEALERLWRSMTERKMYVTGGVGARYEGEAFGVDYELPNSRAYAETCAAIANVMWNWRMLLASGKGRFADIMELALYNGVLSGIALDGRYYFYVNPLADSGGHRRQTWFSTACCPPNIARLLASLPGYFYSISNAGVWVHLYAQSTAQLEVNGKSLTLIQHTDYPWVGEVEMILQPENEISLSVYIRIPGWCRKAELQLNGKPLETRVQPGHYVKVHRLWRAGDKVQLSLSIPVERMVCHPYVSENNDRVALKRGPLVYCVEQVDNPDFDVRSLVLPADASLEAEWAPDLLNGVTVIHGEALSVDVDTFKGYLYRRVEEVSPSSRRVRFTAVPYYAWANREPGPMNVWIRSSAHTLVSQPHVSR